MVDISISRILDIAAAAVPDKVAATLEDDAVTYRQCAQAAARLAHALTHIGLRKGDRVLYWADISLRAIDIFFAVSQAGGVFVPANPAFSSGELDAVLDYLQPAFIIADHARQDEAAAGAARVGATLGVIGGAGAGIDLDAASARASDALPIALASGGDPNVFFLTSGSTGRPKAVIVSHRAHFLRTYSSQSYDAVAGGRGHACMFPLFHMAGWYMILQAFGRRRPIHLTPQASAGALWDIVARHQPQELYCIPAVWRRLLEDGARRDGSCILQALTGTSRVELDLVEGLRRHFPKARNGIYYGSTEMGVTLGIGHEDIFAHPGSVGTPMPYIDARIDDGELLLRGLTAMDGYYNLPAETAEVFQQGWYRTGDLVEVDGDGFYEIVGRRREVIRSGGETVAPAEVEAAILEMDGVEEVAVVGLPDEAWGELVCAVLVMAPGREMPTVEAVRAHLGGRLAAYKHPRIVHPRIDRLPRTGATGQIQRNRIKQDIIEMSA